MSQGRATLHSSLGGGETLSQKLVILLCQLPKVLGLIICVSHHPQAQGFFFFNGVSLCHPGWSAMA